MVNLFLKYFLNNWNFIKLIWNPVLSIDTFYEKLVWGYMPFFGHVFRDVTTAWCFGAIRIRCRTFGGDSIEPIWLDCYRISWWLVPTICGETVNLLVCHWSAPNLKPYFNKFCNIVTSKGRTYRDWCNSIY